MAQMTALRRRMIDDMTVRNLSPATQQSYVYAVAKFSRFFGCSPDLLGIEEVRAYQLHLAGLGWSWSHINQVSCALRFFFGVTLGRPEAFDRIISAKEPKKLLVVACPTASIASATTAISPTVTEPPSSPIAAVCLAQGTVCKILAAHEVKPHCSERETRFSSGRAASQALVSCETVAPRLFDHLRSVLTVANRQQNRELRTVLAQRSRQLQAAYSVRDHVYDITSLIIGSRSSATSAGCGCASAPLETRFP